MKKSLFFAVTLLLSGAAFAGTDHYVLRDGNHVHHLKINTLGSDITVSADVDFEPNAGEEGKHACSADIHGEAKKTADNELTLKKQIEGERRFCTIKIKLSQDGAALEPSADCGYFAAGLCTFNSNGKELIKVK